MQSTQTRAPVAEKDVSYQILLKRNNASVRTYEKEDGSYGLEINANNENDVLRYKHRILGRLRNKNKRKKILKKDYRKALNTAYTTIQKEYVKKTGDKKSKYRENLDINYIINGEKENKKMKQAHNRALKNSYGTDLALLVGNITALALMPFTGGASLGLSAGINATLLPDWISEDTHSKTYRKVLRME